MSQWDSVDRIRGELRAWLHDKQEEVEEIEQQPSKLHAEAAELDIAKLQVRYKSLSFLTQYWEN